MWARALAGLALVCALFALPLLFESAGAEHADLADAAAILAAVLALSAILFGHIAEWRIKRVTGKRSPYALVALVAAYIAVVLAGPEALRSYFVPSPGEASWVGSLRTLNTSCVTYTSTYGFFPAALSDLGPPENGKQEDVHHAGLIDAALASGTKSGYQYLYRAAATKPGGPLDDYTVRAIPLQDAARRRFGFTDTSAVIRSELGKPATKDSPAP